MQLSPNADADTIARVYRMLAARYHPDNTDTGNAEMFLQLSAAHHILADPARRAAYDVQHQNAKRLRWKLFEQAADTIGPEAEKRKRHGILALLYAKTLHNPENADLTIHEFEELLSVPREHLQAALWYLKGKDFRRRSDNGRYSITVDGFEQAETHYAAQAASGRQLTAGSPTAVDPSHTKRPPKSAA